MCMEDIRIGRKSQVRCKNQSATVAGVLAAGYDSNRVSITFSANSTGNQVFIQYGEDASAPLIFNLQAGSNTLHLNIHDHGNLVFGPFFMSGSASTLVGITESLLGEK